MAAISPPTQVLAAQPPTTPAISAGASAKPNRLPRRGSSKSMSTNSTSGVLRQRAP
jgi:hypothetical protein